MSDNGKKTPNKNNRSQSGKKPQPVSKSNVKSTGSQSKTTGNSGKKPALLAQNMNGRRNAGSRSQKKEPVTELEEKGYISRKKPEVPRDKNAEAKKDDIIIIVVTLVCVLMVLSYVGICGIVGTGINALVFGLFGRLGYILPFIIWVLTLFIIANKDNGVSPVGIVYAVLLSAVLGALIQLAAGGYNEEIGLFEYFTNSSLNYEGEQAAYGGLLGGMFVKLLCPLVGKVATVLILIALLLILFVLMTGKPFIMAVFKKISRRIDDYRKRRSIEKSEQDIYEDEEDTQDEAYSHPKVRYGVRRLPRQRMGTMNVEFGKKGEKAGKAAASDKKSEVDKNRKNEQKNSIKPEETKIIEDSTDTGKRKAPESLYIPGVGNVRLGKDVSSEIREEDYTDADFAEVGENEPGLSDMSEEYKRETTRKRDPFEDSGKVTSIGMKKLHSGSFGADRDDPSRIVDITAPKIGDFDSFTDDFRVDLSEDDDLDNDIKDSFTENRISDISDISRRQDDIKERPLVDKKTAESVDQVIKEYDEKHRISSADEKDEVQDSAGKEKTDSYKEKTDSFKEKIVPVAGAAVFTDMTKEPAKPAAPVMPEYKFPSVRLLNKSKSQQGNNSSKKLELENTINKLQSTFESFGVGVKVTDASVGPTVTRYELLPDQGVKVKTITALSDDIKLALAAPEIRIEAPIPGKAAVGIEVPNKESAPVLFGDLIDSDEFRNAKTNLAFTVGKDIGGKSIISDIGDMPHALIAGATGSGKSVCINSLIMSILYKAKPTDVKMIMIDPKRVELVGYNGIPHLIVPVVTDVKKAAGALAWAVAEMDNRYKLFADAGVRDLAAYNNHMVEKWMEESNEGECPDKLPQIVIIVDELNDLMMTANSKDIESDIARLTQLARACGIHVILATQRPSVNVITGTIKANIPTRIAFSVSSIVDSRTILDQAGAEKLLGKGDMLYYPRGYAKPVRLQGVYVSDKEVNDVVDFIKKQYKEMKYNDIVSQHIDAKAAGNMQSKDEGSQQDQDANDEFFEDAARLIIKKQKASVGMLQREFRIGFNRAARIMDSLAEDGVVGPEEGTKPRKILMSLEEFEAYLAQKGQ